MAREIISQSELQKIAKLARLTFSDNEIEQYKGQIDNIMEMISAMESVDISGVDPLTSVCEMKLHMREDVVTETDNSEELFNNAPGSSAEFSKEIKCFIVPKVIE